MKLHLVNREGGKSDVDTNVRQRSDGGVQGVLGVTGGHKQEEASGQLRADAAGRGGNAFSSADQQLRQQRNTLTLTLTSTVGLQETDNDLI